MSSTAQVLLFPDPEESSPGQKLAKVWRVYIETMVAHQKGLNEVRTLERSLFPGMEDYRYSVGGMSERDLEKSLGETAKDMRMRLSWLAARQFAPPGGSLEIDDDALAEAFPVDHYTDLAKLHDFDPAAVWAWLETRYGGQAGERLAHEQLAKRFRSAFGIDRRDEIVTRGGYVILSKTVWTETWSGKVNLSYGCVQTLQQGFLAMSEIASWAGRDQLAHDLYAHGSRNISTSTPITSREKFGFGEQGAEVQMVTFKTSFEFRVRLDFAEQVQVFLGTYGATVE